MKILLFLLVLLFYLLMGIMVAMVINLMVEDGAIKTNFDINKYKLAITSFWPLVPIVFIILGLVQFLTLITDFISEISKK